MPSLGEEASNLPKFAGQTSLIKAELSKAGLVRDFNSAFQF